MKGNAELIAFNRGLISRLALARTDLKRTALSAEIQTNWMPRALGSMMLRPGLGYLGNVRDHQPVRMIDFVFSVTSTALLEMSANFMRVWVDDALVERPAVSAAVFNGFFNDNLDGWTSADQPGAVSQWVIGHMSLTGTGTNAAIRRQQVAVAEPNVLHSLRIRIDRGPVTLRVGSSSGGSEYVAQTALGVGIHSIAFIPSGDFWIEFSNRAQVAALVDSVVVEAAGVLALPSPWQESELPRLRWDQSGDVIFVACEGVQQYRIERRDNNSWSIVLYQPADGPFMVENTGPTTIAASALTGDVALTASAPVFRPGHVGALFRITSVGQRVEDSFTSDNIFTDPIRVTGIQDSRKFTVQIDGTFNATVRLQRSVGEIGAWEDIDSWTAPHTGTYGDGLDNQIIYYRLGIKTGEYVSGQADVALVFTLGSITGIVRILVVSGETTALAEVLTPLGGTAPTDVWAEGAWSPLRGWPSAVALYEGRLWWAGKDRFLGSVTDAFDSFDDNVEGDAGPISRSIGAGPVDTISWLAAVKRLLAGADGSEVSCRSSSLEEVLTRTNFNAKATSREGSARVPAVKVDDDVLFVQRCEFRVYRLAYSAEKYDYTPEDLTALVPDIGRPGIRGMAVQRKPDTRIHCWLGDGRVAVMVFDAVENVRCWVMVETDGAVEDVVVLPGKEEDAVYYVVRRVVNEQTVRYLERWAMESEARGGAVTKLADSFMVYDGAPATLIGGLDHLVGRDVVVWADGRCVGTHTVAVAGTIALAAAASKVMAGLPYEARYQSAKLAYFAQFGTALTQRKKVGALGLILADTHAQGLQFGPDFDFLDDLPRFEDETLVNPDSIWEAYDKDLITFNGTWDTDSRVCLRAAAPRPCTVLAMVANVDTQEIV